MIDKNYNSAKFDSKRIHILDVDWILDRVKIKKEKLKLENQISLNSFNDIIWQTQQAQKKILDVLLEDWEENIEWNYHIIESQLTFKNKYILRDILESIWILYIYENENNEHKITQWIEILSPNNKETNNYILKIIIKRRTQLSPFYIEQLDILKE